MAISSKEITKMVVRMDMVYIFGKLDTSIRVNGKATRNMVKENFRMLMVIDLKDPL